jgi:hypothetical protein
LVIATMALSMPLAVSGSLFVDSSAVYAVSQSKLLGLDKASGQVLGEFGTIVTGAFQQDATLLYIVYVQGAGVHTIGRVSKPALAMQPDLLLDGTPGHEYPNIAIALSQTYFILNALNAPPGTQQLFLGSVAGGANLDTSNGSTLAGDSHGIVWAQSTGALMGADPNFGTKIALNTPTNPAPGAIILDATFAYWYNATDQVIYRSARAGNDLSALVSAPLAHAPGQLALDTSFLYWADGTAGTILRVPNGSTPTTPTILATGQNGAGPIAVDTTAASQAALYWSTGSTITKLANPP